MLNRLTIKAKVIALIVVSLTILTVALTSFAVYKAKTTLMEESYLKLTAARDSKANQITNFFAERIGDIKVLARSSNIQTLATDLDKIYAQLDIEAQGTIPVTNELVKKLTNPHENFFQGYMKDYGYYDVFLLNAEHGHVLYTAAKESDYGANLKYGNLKNSGLGEAYQKVMDLKRPVFIDMKPYAPSNNAPAMFLATPINVDGKIHSVLVFQISDRAINKTMQFRKGYGKSQEDYLVGVDKLMRSDSYLSPKAYSLKNSFANNAQVDTAASRHALEGKTNTEIVIDYNGNPVLSAYGSIKIGEDFKWAILSEVDEAEVLETPNAIRNTIIIIAIGLLAFVVIVAVMVINNIVVKRLLKFQEGLIGFFQYLNREASDVRELEADQIDEIGLMANVVNENIKKAKRGIEEDRNVIENTIAVLGEFEQGDLSKRVNATTSNQSLNELTNLLNKMGDNVEKNIDGVLDVLEEYSAYNYMKQVDTSGIKAHLERLAKGVNSLGKATTQMLIENKTNGITLQDSSHILQQNVDKLNTSSNEAAASLEETAAALEEITENVNASSEKIALMTELSSKVTSSANEGQNLATKTTKSMDEINAQVTAINDAITVIDQISFQTNILSLNAAVEAATAGEAGKGFAVVAGEVRSLAARSAEAASEIKSLVENANTKANEGKLIADSMIKGYDSLNESINKTIELISDVTTASKEQQTGIIQINDAVNSLDQQTQQNAAVATETNEIANQTSNIAKTIVESADEKEFEGKNNIKAKRVETKTATPISRPVTNRTSASVQRSTPVAKPAPSTTAAITSQTSANDEWESF